MDGVRASRPPPTFRRPALSEVGGTVLSGHSRVRRPGPPHSDPGQRNGGTHFQIAVGVGGTGKAGTAANWFV